MLLTEGFLGWGFLGLVKHSSRSYVTRTDRREVGCGGMGGQRDGRAGGYGWIGGQRNGWLQDTPGWAGLQKLITDLDMKNGYKGGA
jgi:hypothetical protein